MRRTLVKLAAGLAAVPLALLAPAGPVTADETPTAAGPDQIVTPADDSMIPAGPVSWSVTAGDVGYFEVTLTCNDDPVSESSFRSDAPGSLHTGTFPSVAGGYCNLGVYNSGTAVTTWSYFNVSPPMPTVVDLTAGPSTFYPRVRDGYQDHVALTFQSRLDSAITVRIREDSTGRTVRTLQSPEDIWSLHYGRRTLTWDGLTAGGAMLPVGRYTAFVTSTLDGHSSTEHVPVWIATGHRNVSVTRVKDGRRGASNTTRGNCRTRDAHPGNRLECRGGTYAQAIYTFTVPSHARNIAWAVRGSSLCCGSGRLVRAGTRVAPTRFRIRVRVTDHRSYVVRRALIRYTVRRQI
ncbi:hypothetical protein ASH02_13985 [Nocardioides sp. Soil796]|nr:hypothetical protein ASH02_13985 [Nocardioides sp. Soil796]